MRIPAPALVRLAVALVLLLAVMAAQASPVPAGFEDLVSGQRERVDVRAFGRSAGLWPAWVTLDHIQLEQPEQVLAALDLSAAAQQALRPALSAPLPRDSHLACAHAQPQPGCGWRAPPEDPTHVHAIFDEGDGALLLFPALRWLPRVQHADAGLHALSEQAENALLHQQSLTLSGSGRRYALNAHGSAVLGVDRAGHLGGSWNYARQAWPGQPTRAHGQFDDLYYRHDLARRHYLQAGRMDRRNLASTQGGQFGLGLLPLERFDGLRVGTTQAYVDADAAIDAAPLTVLLARPARVDAFDGERLLQTFYLPAGASDLDTRQFPAGSYDVTLRIHEDGHLARSETLPFARAQDWGEPGLQWFVQGGRQRARHNAAHAGNGALQAGLRLPLARQLGMSLGVAHMADGRYAEVRTGTRHRVGTHDLHAEMGAIIGSDGSRGHQQQLSLRNSASWSLYRQRLRGSRCRAGTAASRDRLGCADALSASLTVPLAGGSLYVGHTRRRTAAQAWYAPAGDNDRWPDVEPATPAVGAPVAQRTRSVQATFSLTGQWRGVSVATRFGAWRQGGDGRDQGLQLGVTLSRLEHSAGTSRLRRIGVEAHQPRHGDAEQRLLLARSWRQEQAGAAREAAAELSVQDNGAADGLLAVRADTPLGHTGAVLTHYRQSHDSGTAYSFSHASALAVSPRGVYWGSATGADAGLAVSVEQADAAGLDGAAAEVQAGANRRQVLHFGQRRLLPLGGYQRHRVEVHDVAGHDHDVAVRVARPGAAHQPFLLPGRVLALPVGVEATFTYIGSARDATGTALTGARILNAAVPRLGHDGGFIAEFPQREAVLYLLLDGRVLQCPLLVREQRSVVQLVGQVACAALAREALPPSIAQQPRVQRLLDESAPVALGLLRGPP
ncbi:CS1-pili formation C-terminal domain-containing protein [Stenotrophomonas sp. AB1(2024)]|uniref:CS1-pili formation C-terminal domain-containing protein n=1 Tax=Stenotrophomonas sp. AB1(2024) TaxID=3132215 RepID=UPI00309DE7FF